MNIYSFIYVLMFLNFMMMFIFKSYFLMFLISMEFMVLSILMFIFMSILNNDWVFLYFLVFFVCESIIGIVLMINLIYLYGNQSIKFLNLKW